MSRVLVVDDHEDNLLYLSTLLRARGCQVETAHHGAEALAKARQQPPDVVISDLLMPVMDGYTLLRQWKADERLRKVPFVVYTATYTDPQDERLALDLGADAFILKPAEPQPFWARLQEILARAATGKLAEPQRPAVEPTEALDRYSQTLVRKLEEKTQQLETTKRRLESDIEERIRVEDELRKREADLAKAQEMAHIGSFSFDVKGRLTWSDETYRIYGVSPQTYTPDARTFLSLIHPDDRPAMQAWIEEAVAGKQPGELEFRALHPDGTVRTISGRGELVSDAEGRPLVVAGVAQDITDRRAAEEEIHRLNVSLERRVRERTAQLEAANRELEAFSYSVSHDLRAPLRAIDGFAHALLEDHSADLDAEGVRLCSRVRENAARMGRLIEDLLALSRFGHAAITLSPVDMAAMARSVFKDLTKPASRRRIDFEVGPLPAVSADAALMREVWMNLLENAIKFSSQRERAVISVRGECSGGEAVFSVRDNGVGFDMEYADRLFGVFQRLHGADEFEGTGVGLAIVQRIVARHGGRVWAEGTPDGGATFSFALQEQAAQNDKKEHHEEDPVG